MLEALVTLDGVRAGDVLTGEDGRPDLEVVALVAGQDLVALLAGLGVGALDGADHGVGRQLGGPADLLLGGLRLLVVGHAGQLDEDAVLALARPARLGDTEGVHPTAEHLEGLVDVIGFGRRLLGALGLEHELGAAPEVETEVGLLVEGQDHAPGQQAEHEEEPDEGTA